MSSLKNEELTPLLEFKKLIVDNDIENEILSQLLSIKFNRKQLKSKSNIEKTENNNITSSISLITKNSKIKLRLDDNFLNRFLTTGKNDPNKALKRYKSYYKTILLLPCVIDIIEHDYSWFTESTEYLYGKTEYLNGTNLAAGVYGYDKYERVIIGFQCELFDLDSPNFDKYCWYGLMVLFEYVSTKYHEKFQSKGYVFVGNFKGFTYKMLSSLATTNNLKIISKFLKGSIPASAKNVFLCGEPQLFNWINKMLKPFLTNKVANRMYLVGKNHKKISDALGGEEYTPNFITGGKLEPITIPGQNIIHAIELIEQVVPQLVL